MPPPVRCSHALACAGCPLIDLPYERQLEKKRERVQAAMARYIEIASTTVDATEPAPRLTGYRVRAKLMVAPARSPAASPRLGLYNRSANGDGQTRDHVVVDIPECQVLAPALQEAAGALRRVLQAPPAAADKVLKPSGAGGWLAAFDLREIRHAGASAVLVTVVLDDSAAPDQDALRTAARAIQEAIPHAAGVALNLRRSQSPQVLGASTQVLSGVSEAPDASSAVYHLATYGAFTQANRAQAGRLGELVLAQLTSAGPIEQMRVLELYAGLGALSLPLAARGARVTMVESFGPAANAAARAAAAQGLSVDVRTGDAARVAHDLAQAGVSFDAVLVNPPRRGLSPEARSALGELAPSALVYVSCDPETLARDLSHFARLGFFTKTVTPVDMMPLTDQVETVVGLRRDVAPPPRTLYRDEQVHVVEWPAYQAPIAPSPDARLVGTAGLAGSGIAVWTASPAALPMWRDALESARKQYLVLARGITHQHGSLRSGSRYRRQSVLGGHSLLQVSAQRPIARDLARIGHPIVGDDRHGHAPTNRHFEEKYALDRAFVHASKVELCHPKSGQVLTLAPPLPGELSMVLARLGDVFTSKSPVE